MATLCCPVISLVCLSLRFLRLSLALASRFSIWKLIKSTTPNIRAQPASIRIMILDMPESPESLSLKASSEAAVFAEAVSA